MLGVVYLELQVSDIQDVQTNAASTVHQIKERV